LIPARRGVPGEWKREKFHGEFLLLLILNLRFKNGKNIIYFFNKGLFHPLLTRRNRGPFTGKILKGSKPSQQERKGEERVSTQQYPPEKNPRVQETDVDQGGETGSQSEAGEGKKKTNRESQRILKIDSP